jgi:hypothetical protein
VRELAIVAVWRYGLPAVVVSELGGGAFRVKRSRGWLILEPPDRWIRAYGTTRRRMSPLSCGPTPLVRHPLWNRVGAGSQESRESRCKCSVVRELD